MKSIFPHIGLARLCGWFGITRQAYYQNNWECISTSIEEELIIQKVKAIRKSHPRMGGKKLNEKLQAFNIEHSIKMGRDALFDLLSKNKLLIRRRKRKIQTTNSYHRFKKYPNLIREFIPNAANQLWVSDITYWKISTGRHLYISFITDAYSHRIVGYHVAESLETVETLKALKMALSALGAEHHFQLIHHSDRGIQYCSNNYVKLLQEYNVQISMTENGDPLENAVAERLNGILKQEYLETYTVNNIRQAKQLLESVVYLYNSDRPHSSIGNLTPDIIHYGANTIIPERLWKNYYKTKLHL